MLNNRFVKPIRRTLPEENTEVNENLVIGRNAVRELLKGERTIDKILVQKGERNGSIIPLIAQAKELKIPIIDTEKNKLDAMAGNIPHQGIIAQCAEKEYCTVEDLLATCEEKNEKPFFVICDGITDPHNLGAIIRSADCCGANGVIIPKRRSVGLTSVVEKASAGALEHMPVAKVANIAQTVEKLKENGIWVYAAEAGGTLFYDADFQGAIALVVGSEGEGVTPLVKKVCDGVLSIPLYGHINSFNVSAATAIFLAEMAKKRHQGK